MTPWITEFPGRRPDAGFLQRRALLWLAWICLVVPAGVLAAQTGPSSEERSTAPARSSSAQAPTTSAGQWALQSRKGAYAGKKILMVCSYHEGYQGADDKVRGARMALEGTGVNLKLFHMDAKRNDSEEYGRQAGIRAKAAMDEFKPDVVIAADDNAQKYLVVPFLKNTGLPVVFCGVNWDASIYGYPCKNVTGMIEVEMIEELQSLLRRFSRGSRFGFIGGDVETERKDADYLNRHFFNGQMKMALVKNMEEFKTQFLKIQNEVDILYFNNCAGITKFDPADAEKFLAENTRIPTGGNQPGMERYVAVVIEKSLEEHGIYAARTALKILDGAHPADLPVAKNSRIKLIVNLKMAKPAGIVFPLSVLKEAHVIGQEAYGVPLKQGMAKEPGIPGKTL
ncbi:MAG: hypothetical protein NTX50_00815 [Candidatus Sumerlaeota bacterium]|nr:hypothetical protein [Candidatus Sumerlaeota bacterium]